MKRYAIVRVDDKCIDEVESRIRIKCNNECFFNELKCPYDKIYGDTKEQLIRKVAQVIRKRTDNGIIVRYREDSISAEEIAKEIVEFLGVME